MAGDDVEIEPSRTLPWNLEVTKGATVDANNPT